MGEETVESILEFLNDGTNRIKPSPSRNVILVLGDSGTGKTTLTQFLASKDDNLIAEKVGSSGYTITDPSRAICESTIESCTVTPELVIDQRGNQTYYDCPGFRDTRSVTYDIGTTYFVRKVIDKADAIKIIFTVNYNDVRKGGSRHDFTKLVENVFTMFKDIKKYEDSVCLVVNKVENAYEEVDGNLKIVPDDVMLQDIIEFLKGAKTNLYGKLETDNPKEKVLLYERTIQLIDIFINEKDPKASRVGIFRRPNKPGPLGKMKEFQLGKMTLQKMIYDKLIYTATDKADFRYTISENSKLRLHDIEKRIVQRLFQEATILGQQVVNQYRDLEKTSTDIDELLVELMTGRDRSLKVKLEVSEEKITYRLFIKELISYLDQDGFIPREKLQVLNNYGDYMEFIETMIGSTTNHSDQWQNSLARLWSYFDESVNWYSFLIDLRVTLSEYSLQDDVDKYSKLIDAFRVSYLNHNPDTYMTNMKQFLLQINEDSGRNYEIPNVEEVEKIKLRFFLELLDVEFKPMSAECQENKLEVKGWNVKMSEVVKKMGQCTKGAVEIFAFNKIFVDADFIKKGGQLTIIAPELEVVNNRRIVLDGEDAPEHSPRAAVTISTIPGSKGVAGLPGLPGGSAGELVSVVQNCKNCNSLSVTAVGGTGGTGQDGGDGVPGRDGDRASILGIATKDEWMEAWQQDGFSPDCGGQPRQRRGAPVLLVFLAGLVVAAAANASHRIKCFVTGKSGEPGGNGGDGGVGGEGGYAGRVEMSYEKSPTTNGGPKITLAKGPQGSGGEGGNGAKGGYDGDTLHQDLIEYTAFNSTTENVHYQKSFTVANSGIPGESGLNEVGLIHPESGNNIDLSYSLYKFKNYLQLSMGNSIINSTMKNFVEYFKLHEKSKRSISVTKHQSADSPVFSKVPFTRMNSENADIAQGSKLTEISTSIAQAESDGNHNTGYPNNYDLINAQSNLLLMDVLIRKVKGDTKHQTRGMRIDDSNDEYSHALAYNAHAPF